VEPVDTEVEPVDTEVEPVDTEVEPVDTELELDKESSSSQLSSKNINNVENLDTNSDTNPDTKSEKLYKAPSKPQPQKGRSQSGGKSEASDSYTLATSVQEGTIITERDHKEFKPNSIYYPTKNPELNWLNDSSPHSITIDNMSFPTLEHYYSYMKFLFGLEEPLNKDILSFGYKKIISKSSMNKVKKITGSKGMLRHFMKNFNNKKWDAKKDKILFYGRLFKVKQHPELQAKLVDLHDKKIYKKVKSVGSIPKNKLDKFLGSDIYYDNEEDKWYGGTGQDKWNDVLEIVKEGNLEKMIG
jgi:predicted NAD-dependent protein-ADP-ribosyltransferase YbiA (DUF1768 family)